MDAEPGPTATETTTRAGFITLLGVPNAGKSTLMNALVGQRLSIVTPRPQTTLRRVLGIRTDERSQMIFLDTPGVLQPRDLIHEALVMEARAAVGDADILLLVLDPLHPISDERREFLETFLTPLKAPILTVVTKSDLATPGQMDAEVERARALSPAKVLRVSPLTGEGIEDLLDLLRRLLPESPFLYPPDEVATLPVRFFVSELVRETVFEQFREEVPYATFCEVEEFRDGGSRTYIQVNIYVERSSQKGILIGDRGSAIRELGRTAREKIEHFLQGPVYLDLWVKVLPRWRKKRGELRRLGLPVPENHASKR